MRPTRWRAGGGLQCTCCACGKADGPRSCSYGLVAETTLAGTSSTKARPGTVRMVDVAWRSTACPSSPPPPGPGLPDDKLWGRRNGGDIGRRAWSAAVIVGGTTESSSSANIRVRQDRVPRSTRACWSAGEAVGHVISGLPRALGTPRPKQRPWPTFPLPAQLVGVPGQAGRRPRFRGPLAVLEHGGGTEGTRRHRRARDRRRDRRAARPRGAA